MLLRMLFICKDDEAFHILLRGKQPISQHAKHPTISPHDRVYPTVSGLGGRFRLSRYTAGSYRIPRSGAQQEPTTVARYHASESTHHPEYKRESCQALGDRNRPVTALLPSGMLEYPTCV